MRLHEEYLNRKKIRIPLVLFERNSGILLRTKNPPYSWRLLSFYWRHDEHWHPGCFEFCSYNFEHNSYSIRGEILRVNKVKKLFWDEYEEYVINLVSSLKDNYIAVSGKEIDSAICKILFTVCDKSIAELGANGILESNFWKHASDVLNENNQIEVQTEASKQVIQILNRASPQMTENVVFDIRDYLKDSNWLASLFRDDKKELLINSN